METQSIKQQWDIAREISKALDGIATVSQHFIAGGAPSDWYSDRLARDLDFWVVARNPNMALEELTNKLGVQFKNKSNEKYLEIRKSASGLGKDERREKLVLKQNGLLSVHESSYKDMSFEIMFLSSTPEKPTPETVVSQFDFSTAQFWYTSDDLRNGDITKFSATIQALDSHNKKTLLYTTSHNYNRESVKKRFKKYLTKYPNYNIQVSIRNSERVNPLVLEQSQTELKRIAEEIKNG